MFIHRSQPLPSDKKRKGPNKLIAGFAALAATAIITAGGFAAATPQTLTNPHNPPMAGYGGGNTSIVNNINLNLNNSNHNAIQIIVNIWR